MSDNGSERTNTGRIIEIKGVVLDAVFTDELPEIYTALEIEIAGEDGATRTLVAEVQQHLGDDRVRAVLDVFKERLVKRSVSLKALDHKDPEPAAGGTSRLLVAIKQGIDDEKAKAIVKRIKADGPKGAHAQVQGDTVRVSSKKRDDLQAIIAMHKDADFGIPLQFQNYR